MFRDHFGTIFAGSTGYAADWPPENRRFAAISLVPEEGLEPPTRGL